MDVFDYAIAHHKEMLAKPPKLNEEEITPKIDVAESPVENTLDFSGFIESYRILLRVKYGIIDLSRLNKKEWSVLYKTNINQNNLRTRADVDSFTKYLKKIIKSYSIQLKCIKMNSKSVLAHQI